MQEEHRVWTTREATALKIAKNRNNDALVVYGKTVPIPRRTPGLFRGTVEAFMVAGNTFVPVTLMGVRYRIGREVVVGWYDQESFERVVECL